MAGFGPLEFMDSCSPCCHKWTEASDTACSFSATVAYDSSCWDGDMLYEDIKNEMLVSPTPEFFLFVCSHSPWDCFCPKGLLTLVISNVESLLPCSHVTDHITYHLTLLSDCFPYNTDDCAVCLIV